MCRPPKVVVIVAALLSASACCHQPRAQVTHSTALAPGDLSAWISTLPACEATAEAGWRNSSRPSVDRRELAEDVEERRRKLEEDEAVRGGHPGLAERLAIEAALIDRGLLTLTKGGWC